MRLSLALVLTCGGVLRASADAGMWAFHDAPTAAIQKAYGFAPTQEWLDHARLSSVRVAGVGSASFVSPDGLVLTNQHVARGAVGKVSTPQADLVKDGFVAASRDQEIPLKDTELNVLVSMEDVTARVRAAESGAATPEEAAERRKAETERIAAEAESATGLRCDVVPLYQGGEYWLYRYKRFTDVRLVMIVENQASYFGGDDDNFTYPRHALDFAFLRVYEDGKPYKPEHWLRWSPASVKEGELVFVTGHPGATRRLKTEAQLASLRDVELPMLFDGLKRNVAALEAYSREGSEQERQALPPLKSYENALKATRGKLQALADPALFARKRAEEKALREAVAAVPALQREHGAAWDDVAEARRRAAERHRFWLRDLAGGPLADVARGLVLYVQELAKPSAERYEEFRDSALKSLEPRLFSSAPVYPELEKRLLAARLERARDALGADDPFVREALAGASPAEAAERALSGTRLADPEFRRALAKGGVAALEASEDPLVRLALVAARHYREQRSWFERFVEGVETAASALVARARFAVYGKTLAPDATFTLRLSYGRAAGYWRGGTRLPYKTTFAGLYDRSDSFDGRAPFDLSPKLAAARGRVDMSAPLNFANTTDTIGGNSGSPMLNAAGELVGLNFDGNIEKLANDFSYAEGGPERAVAVDAAAILEALRNVYGASTLVEELTRTILLP